MSDIEIAQAASKRPIVELMGERFGVKPEHLVPYGHDKAKLALDYV
ncbi:MAG: formate--tetrahydrofolate ligase, partial [Gammaproteobacteria bacterium]